MSSSTESIFTLSVKALVSEAQGSSPITQPTACTGVPGPLYCPMGMKVQEICAKMLITWLILLL